jgi:hypothetical protein
VTISTSCEVSSTGHVVRNFAAEEPLEVCKFGETEYVNEHVLHGPGRASLPPKLTELLALRLPIADVPAGMAEYLAHGIIMAAEEISSTTPIPSGNGIGGGVTVFLVQADDVTVRESPAL